MKELLIFLKSLIPIEIVLLDCGFYTWGVIKVLQELKLRYIIMVPKYDKFKEWLKKGAGLREHRGRLEGCAMLQAEANVHWKTTLRVQDDAGSR